MILSLLLTSHGPSNVSALDLKHSVPALKSQEGMAVDGDIIALIGAGRNHEAFDLIVNRYQNKAIRLAYSIVGEAAEDAAQDAFLRVWRALPAYRGEASLSTWIYTIVRNTALSLRRRIPEGIVLRSLAEPHVMASAESVPRGVVGESATPDLLREIQQFPEPQRQTVILYYLEGKSYLETAELLNLPMGTVKTYLHRARKDLAASILKGSS